MTYPLPSKILEKLVVLFAVAELSPYPMGMKPLSTFALFQYCVEVASILLARLNESASVVMLELMPCKPNTSVTCHGFEEVPRLRVLLLLARINCTLVGLRAPEAIWKLLLTEKVGKVVVSWYH